MMLNEEKWDDTLIYGTYICAVRMMLMIVSTFLSTQYQAKFNPANAGRKIPPPKMIMNEMFDDNDDEKKKTLSFFFSIPVWLFHWLVDDR